jgi:SAM-dependent methyltransferase
MRHDLYRDLYVKEQEYWWHVGKREIVYGLLQRYLRGRNGRRARRALDLGCGTGHNLDHLSRYAQAVGTDFSEEALRFCRERGHAQLCKADAANLPFRDEEFDIVTALDVVEHLDDDVVALRELWRIMRPGGLLIISVPAYSLLWSYWDDILGHRRRYTTRSLSRAASQAGYQVRKVSYSNALILMPSVLVRLLKSSRQGGHQKRGEAVDPETDFMPVPGWLNKALIAYYRLEARVLRRIGLPFGLSVVCVAQRPPEDGR